MDIKSNQEATVFEPKESEKRKNAIEANLSTYEGKDKDDKVRYSSWWTTFVGKAFDKAKDLKDRDRIVILSGKVEQVYVKEKDRSYTNVTIFDYDIAPKKDKKDE